MVKRLTSGHAAQNLGLCLQTLHSFYSTSPSASFHLLLPVKLFPNRPSGFSTPSGSERGSLPQTGTC